MKSKLETVKEAFSDCIQRLEDFKKEFGGDLKTMTLIPHAKNQLEILSTLEVPECKCQEKNNE